MIFVQSLACSITTLRQSNQHTGEHTLSLLIYCPSCLPEPKLESDLTLVNHNNSRFVSSLRVVTFVCCDRFLETNLVSKHNSEMYACDCGKLSISFVVLRVRTVGVSRKSS